MSETRAYNCEICGLAQRDSQGWFLVRSEHSSDRVSVLRWDERRAQHKDVHSVCSADHARELVARWVFSGTLCCGALGARWRIDSPSAVACGEPPAAPRDPRAVDLDHLDNATPGTLLAILDAVEVVLHDKLEQVEEDDQEVLLYDA
jgi:hypothetical protein